MTTMDISIAIKKETDRIAEIDKQQSELRDERRQCIIRKKKLENALVHINEILEGKTEETTVE